MKTIAITYTPYLVKLSALLAAVIIMSVLLYGIFMLEAVAQTAKRTSAERQVRDLASRVSSLEGNYLASTRELTPARAAELGYVTPVKTTTVFASANSLSLSASSGTTR
jgi:hypothetical protein